MKRLYNQKEIARLIAISESQIRYWDRIGLIPPRERHGGQLWFDFKGLVALRAVKGLRDQGVSFRQIKRCVEKLKQVLPELEQPLAEVRLTVARNQLVIRKKDRLFTPEGQLLLDFSPESRPPIPLRLDITEELFFEALECEQEGEWDEARRRYTAILQVRPDYLDALVNLGNLLHRAGSHKQAETYYRQALQINPDHVEANYNLGNLLEERRDLDNAMLFYRKAIHEDQEFADAYFNLARVLETRGDLEEAKKYWRTYLELEPGGEWSDYVKNRLEERAEGGPGS